MLSAQKKADLIADYQCSQNDTGSPEVQIALLTHDILALSDHFTNHQRDHHSRQGLLRKINQRRKLLDYLKKKDLQRYQDLIGRLGLRR